MSAAERLLTVTEVAERLGISPQTVYSQVRDDRFPIRVLRIGKLLRFRETDVQAFIEGDQ